MIAALFVAKNGGYFCLPDVDPWDEARDARKYGGPWPVVAHPPCSRWCQLAYIVQKRYGHKVGDDGGCFASALASVRAHGGILEHPAFSYAWEPFKLPRPRSGEGWTKPDAFGGRSCSVEQGHYGHLARKATWLYAVSEAPLPELVWGRSKVRAWVGYMANRSTRQVQRLTKKQAASTPEAFRDILIEIARNARTAARAA